MQPTVVYLLGVRHSGSTLVDAVVGSQPRCRSLGQAAGFHRYADHERCDCGERSAACNTCSAVLVRLRDSDADHDFARIHPLALRERRLLSFLFSRQMRRKYASLVDLVYDAVTASTGAPVLVDSSKNLSRAVALCDGSARRIVVVHLVRDPRSFLASSRRRGRSLGPLGLARAMVHWGAKNAAIAAWSKWGRADPVVLRWRYEDLVNDPDGHLAQLADVIGLPAPGEIPDPIRREHLFEPPRSVDYSAIQLDPTRARSAGLAPHTELACWALGGFVGLGFGYRPGVRR